jgi:16S rRNA (guanine966-N2)-methyltransferase
MQPQKTDIRIIAGSLKGRRVTCIVKEDLRPTPQRTREALFSILGNAIPGRPFYDVFSGTGVIGMEAISRGASEANLLERDGKLASDITSHLIKFGIQDKARVIRTDVYRWAERWIAPRKPINVFFSPPFPDLTERNDDFIKMVTTVVEKVADESVVTIQAEEGFPVELVPNPAEWDLRKYGRNLLMFLVKGEFGLDENGEKGDHPATDEAYEEHVDEPE